MKLVAFDLDGVLVDIDSSWETVHKAFSTDNEENFQKHLRGEIDFKEFMQSDIRLWGRTSIKQIANILDKAPIMAAAPEVIDELKKEGFKTAIISSGISLLAERVKKTLNIDYAYSNKLLVDGDGWLTGEGEEIVSLANKDIVLKRLSEETGIGLRECAVVGDSRFDIPLFREAGLSIAFNAQDEAVKRAADLVIDGKDLRKVLPWLKSENLMKTEASLRYSSAREAEAIARSLSTDNAETPLGLQVRTWSEGKTVKIKVACIRRVETMLSTLDDIFACMQVAEKTIKAARSV